MSESVIDQGTEYDDDQPSTFSPVRGGKVLLGSPSPGFSGGRGTLRSPTTTTTSTSANGNPLEKWMVGSEFLLNHAVTANIELVPPPTPVNTNYDEEEEDVVDGGTEKEFVAEEPFVPLVPQTDQDEDDGRIQSDKSDEVEDDQDVQRETSKNVQNAKNELKDGNGWASPASSQGSMDSMEFIIKNLEGIQQNSRKVHYIRTQTSVENVLPKEAYKAIQRYFDDEHGVKRFLSYVKNDIMATAHKDTNKETAEQIEKQLESLEKYALLGVIGRVLNEKYTSAMKEAQEHIANGTIRDEIHEGKADVDRTETEMVPNSVPDFQRSLSNEEFPESQLSVRESKLFKIEPSKLSPISTSNFIPVENAPKRRKTREQVIISKISDETWVLANDKWVLHETKQQASKQVIDKQVEKVAQVFFDEIFEHHEKMTCTVSGKKGSIPFDEMKLRILRRSVAYIMLNKSIRGKLTSADFQKVIRKNNFQELSSDLYEVIKKRVLTEYAYRYRKKNKNTAEHEMH